MSYGTCDHCGGTGCRERTRGELLCGACHEAWLTGADCVAERDRRRPGACAMHNDDPSIPIGWVEVQRDDEVRKFADDESAADSVSRAARLWETSSGRAVSIVPVLDAIDAGALDADVCLCCGAHSCESFARVMS